MMMYQAGLKTKMTTNKEHTMKITLKNNVRTNHGKPRHNYVERACRKLNDNQGYSITRTSLARQIEQETPAYSWKLIGSIVQ